MRRDPAEELPPEDFGRILSFLSLYTLLRAREVSSEWRKLIAQSAPIWRAHFLRHFPYYSRQLQIEKQFLPGTMSEFVQRESVEYTVGSRPTNKFFAITGNFESPTKELFRACKEGDEEVLGRLVPKLSHQHLELRDRNGRTALYYAFINGHQNLCDLVYSELKDKSPGTEIKAGEEIILALVCYQQPDIVWPWIRHWKWDLDLNAMIPEIQRTLLIFSIELGHYDMVDALLRAGANVNQPVIDRDWHLFPLAQAIKFYHSKIIERLLSENPEVSHSDIFFSACESGNVPLVEKLHQKGADINCVSSRRGHRSPVSCVVHEGKVAMTQCLVSLGADVDEARFDWPELKRDSQKVKEAVKIILLKWLEDYAQGLDKKSEQAAVAEILKSVLNGRELSRRLLDFQSIIETDPVLSRIVYCAMGVGIITLEFSDLVASSEKLKCLSEENQGLLVKVMEEASFNQLCFPNYLIQQGLVYAVKKNHFSLAEGIIDLGVDAGMRDKDGNTLLKWACENLNLPMLNLLLEKGVPFDVRVVHNAGNTFSSLLFYLVLCLGRKALDSVDLIKCLLEKGARLDLGETDEVGFTLLHYACRYDLPNLINFFLEKGASLEAASRKGFTPLHTASFNGSVKAVQILLNAGANLEAKAKYVSTGDTPLHVAILRGHLDVVKLLVEGGADLDAKNDSGHTPELLARPFYKIAAFLKECKEASPQGSSQLKF